MQTGIKNKALTPERVENKQAEPPEAQSGESDDESTK